MANRSARSDIFFTFEAALENEMTDGEVVAAEPIKEALISGTIESGTQANQASRAWSSAHRELASGASETLDLYEMAGIDIGGGSGNDALGLACLFEMIVTLVVKHEEG